MDRIDALRELLVYEKPSWKLNWQLRKFSWDADEALVILTREHIASVLNRYLAGELNEKQVEDWADLIEGREDIDFDEMHEDVIRDLMHELANPLLTQELSHNSAKKMLDELSTNEHNNLTN